MMSDDRRRILQMVADGTISAEEATELLDALQPEQRRDTPPPEAPMPPRPPRPVTVQSVRSPRVLIIQVTEGESNRVNLRIPLGLARAAGKFIPRKAQEHLGEYGIDLTSLFEGITDSDEGVILQVQDEEDRVLIAVE